MKTLKIALSGLFVGSFALSYCSEVGYWSFDEGAGSFVGDGSSFGNNGSLVNQTGTNWIGGRFGSALRFDGTVGAGNTRVEIADSASLRLSNAGTFAAWILSEDLSRDAPIFAKEGPGGALSYWFGTYGPSGTGHWGNLMDQDGNQAWDYNGRDQGSIVAGQWVHLATTWDGTTVSYYVNGTLTNTGVWTGTIHESTARLFIGSNAEYTFESNATAFKGGIDEVHIYNSAISAAEVETLATVPEPTTLAVIGIGIVGLLARRRKGRPL